MKKIVLIGANGQIGMATQRLLTASKGEFECIALSREELDLSKTDQITNYLLSLGEVDAIINAAAYTAVDQAEENEQAVQLINALACQRIAEAAKALKVPFIHYSTDYVYHNGVDRPIKEHDPSQPKSIYAKSKLAGEQLILQTWQRSIILRVSWVFYELGNNFLLTMLKLARDKTELQVVDDQIGTPTYAADIADISLLLIEKSWQGDLDESDFGIYNFSNSGVASWFDFAHCIFEYADIEMDLKAVNTEAFPRPAERPKYSILSKRKIEKLLPDYKIPYWRDAVRRCLKKISEMSN